MCECVAIFRPSILRNYGNLVPIYKKGIAPDFNKKKAIFFLDAHVDNAKITNYINKCPLFNELEAIGNLEKKDHILLIDDVRIIKSLHPWGETSYGDINFLEKIKEKILSINENYKFEYLDGHIENDVLYCYI